MRNQPFIRLSKVCLVYVLLHHTELLLLSTTAGKTE
jgi:hypothetical protein